MLETMLTDMRSIIASYRTIEQTCRELGVSLKELEAELTDGTSSFSSLEARAVRSTVRRLINERNLREAAVETEMPTTLYLTLKQTLTTGPTANTSLRDDRPIPKEEFMRRARTHIQGSLFDESEVVVSVPKMRGIEWEDEGVPFT